MIADLERSVVALPERATTPSGRLRVTAAPDFAAVVLADILAGFTQRYPEVELDVHLSSQFIARPLGDVPPKLQAFERYVSAALATRKL